MILVTLGTQDKSFVRLLEKIEELIEKKVINERVVVQAGFTKFKSENMEIFNLIPKDEFDELIKNSRYIISHGGVGTILTALNNNKKVIGVARLKKYKEHVNDHQVQLIEHFTKDGYILGVDVLDELDKRIKEIDSFKPNKYNSNTKKMIRTLEREISTIKSRRKTIIIRLILFLILLVSIIMFLN